jgi:hypothetical protein
MKIPFSKARIINACFCKVGDVCSNTIMLKLNLKIGIEISEQTFITKTGIS